MVVTELEIRCEEELDKMADRNKDMKYVDGGLYDPITVLSHKTIMTEQVLIGILNESGKVHGLSENPTQFVEDTARVLNEQKKAFYKLTEKGEFEMKCTLKVFIKQLGMCL